MSLYVVPLSVAVPDGRNSARCCSPVCAVPFCDCAYVDRLGVQVTVGSTVTGNTRPGAFSQAGSSVICSAGAPFAVTSW